MQVFGDGFRGTLHIADIRLLILVQRSGNGDGHRVHALDEGKIAGRGKGPAFHHMFQRIAHNVADIIFARVDGIDLLGLNVKADGPVAGLCKFHGEGKPDIPQADNADDGGLVLNFIQQLSFHV